MQKTAPHEALRQVLTSVAGEPLVILLAGHPDPDSIGSALAHQRVCEDLGVPATIAHVLPISHRENRALVKLLHLEMLRVASGSELSRFKYLSLVDTCSAEQTIELPHDLKLLTVVDHHNRRGVPIDAPFVDLRTDIGASSTIYAEYMQEGLSPLTGQRRQDAKLASALLFGIQTDSDDFTLATPADFLAAAYLRTYADADLLTRLSRRVVGAAAMDVLGRALANLMVVRDFAFAGVGMVSLNDRDAIPAAADYILRREDLDTVVVYGVVEDRIDGSLRTNSPTVDPAAFLERAFGLNADGRPYGGGRADKGGFQIPLGIFTETSDPEALWRLVQDGVQSRLARVVPNIEHPREVSPRKVTA
jgi:nanoRNase/pAp phosphatase (c-di-AMP/oligoRNAs hydrolase)